MGTLNTKLTLTAAGSGTTTTAGFSISASDALGITAPVVNLASGSVTNSGHDILVPTSASSVTYLYVKYKTKAGGTPVLVASTVSGTQNVMDLAEGEAIFIPVKGAVGLRVTSSDSNSITYEYGYWTKS